MKKLMTVTLLMALSFSASADFSFLFKKTDIVLSIGGDTIIIQAHLSDLEYESSNQDWSIHLDNIVPIVEGRESQKLYLKPQFGWGDTPLNKICQEVGRMFGKTEIQYADAGGDQLKTFSVFSNPTFLVIGKGDSYKISNSEQHGAYYTKGLTCTSVEYIY